MDNVKPVAMITGASAGIGAAFARRLARDGYRLMLVARRRDRLEALANELGGAEVIPADLTSEAELKTLEERILSGRPLDLLVNNAGFGTRGRFFQSPAAGQIEMHRLHVMATVRLTHAALSVMVPRARGAIINVSSVAGFGQMPGSVSYCATKAWMTSFTEGLYLELKAIGSPVKVQALCPGYTLSEFHEVAGMDRKAIPAPLWCSAEKVVDASLRGLARGKLFVIPGGVYKIVVQFQTWMPRWLRRAVVTRYSRVMRRVPSNKSGT